MFSLTGTIFNCFFTPATEKYPEPSYKVQLLGDQLMKDGQVKKEMVTLKFPHDAYVLLEKNLGNTVSMPIGLFVSDGRLQPFFPKGRTSEIVTKVQNGPK